MQQNFSKLKSKKRIPFETKNQKTKKYEFLYSSGLSPHPQKIDKGGEDALFVSKNVIALADGVGSWKDFGVDPGIYSKKLVQNIAQLIRDEQKRNYYIDNPQKLACAAVNLNKFQGSSTLSIATLHPTSGLLRTYHIGDSVYGIFHPTGEYVLGMEQQYFFNQPFQVGSNFIHRHSNQEMQFCNPDGGIYNQFNFSEVKKSHLVLASDGIWDNLFPHQIHQVLKQSETRKLQANEANTQVSLNYSVDRLLSMTKSTYTIKEYESPFYVKGKQMGLNVGKFAKVDDLSLVIAKISQIQKNSEITSQIYCQTG